jgi:gamma-glutamylputrescine oxidase
LAHTDYTPEDFRPLPDWQPSYWEISRWFGQRDVVVIGAGITGSFIAYFLKQKFPGRKIVVIDAHTPPRGATTRNAGFACFGSISEYVDDKSRHGTEYAAKLIIRRFEGLEILRDTFKNDDIQFRQDGGFEIFQPHEKDIFQSCLEHLDEVNNIFKTHTKPFKEKSRSSVEAGLNSDIKVIANALEGSIHSGAMLNALHRKLRALDIDILTGISVRNIYDSGSKISLETSWGIVDVHECIVATNGFAKELLPELDVLPNRGQILVTSPVPGLFRKGNFHYDQGYYYLRHLPDKRVLLGGGRHLNIAGEQTESMIVTEEIQSSLEKLLHEVFLVGQHFTVEYRWAGIMAFGSQNEKEPLVGRKGNIHYAVRMGGMGVALAPLIAKEFAENF